MKTKKVHRVVSVIALFLIVAMVLGTIASALTGCGAAEESVNSTESTETAQTQTPTESETENASEVASEAVSEVAADETSKKTTESDTTIRVAALKGATTIGLVNLISDAEAGNSDLDLEFTMYTAGSDIMAAFVSGSCDIGLVPSNIAAVMNTKVEGGVSVIDINTLGVLNCVSADDSIKSIEDLSGKTVYMTGQGATPEFTVKYLLKAAGVTDCTLEFKSEPTEIVSIFAEDASAVAILPQPFVTAALAQNENLKIAFSLDDAWEKSGTDGRIVTGVTVVSNSFLNEHKDAVDAFLKAHKESADKALSDVDGTASLVVAQGIIAKEPLAKKAIPNCNIVCITGNEMKDYLSGYLKVLFDEDPKSLGGTLPGDEFYYVE